MPRVREFLSDYVAGDLASEVRATFERHLRAARNCVTYLEQFRATIGRKAGVRPARRARTSPEELVRAILAARRR